jgi:two-component system OmpR family sensor kinase
MPVLDRISSEWVAMPLRRRLVLGLLTVLSGTLIVVALATFLGVRHWTLDQLDSSLMKGKEKILSTPSSTDGDRDNHGPSLNDVFLPWTLNAAIIYRVYPDGTAAPLVSAGSAATVSAADTAALASVPTDPSAGPVTINLALGDSRAVAVPNIVVTSPTGALQETWTAVAVMPTSRATNVFSYLLLFEFIAMGFALLVAGLAATWFIRRSLRPLSDVAETAKAVAQLPLERGDVAIPARVSNPIPTTEVGQVGLAVNAMLDHVESSLQTRADTEDRLRRFVSDAGHELRTPLAAVRGYAELMRRGAGTDPEQSRHAAERIEAAGSRMGMLVEDLLLLASLDEQRPIARDIVDLRALVDEAVAEAATAGPDHEWGVDDSWDTDGTGFGDGTAPDNADEQDERVEPITVVGDAVRLHQAVGNLLANARAHTPGGTAVTVRLSQDDSSAYIEVVDDGPGFPDSLLPRVTERFARGDASRSRATGGSGLGLAIVRAIAEAHGGSIEVGNDAESHGALVRISVPNAGPPSTVKVDAVPTSATLVLDEDEVAGTVRPAGARSAGTRSDHSSAGIDGPTGAGAVVAPGSDGTAGAGATDEAPATGSILTPQP